MTPLHYAMMLACEKSLEYDEEIIYMLIQAGADLKKLDIHSQSPADLAREDKNSALL